MNIDLAQVKAIFLQAAEQSSAAARQALLAKACGDDAELRQHVEVLLAAHEQAGSFLEQGALTREATLDQTPLERPGTQIGPYKLLQQIGEGGMGTVYMADQTEPVRRKVALKVIKAGMDTHQVVARFEAERQALAMMDHVNIARVLDCGTTENGRPYFVMELVNGVPITKYCDDNCLTPRQRLELFVPVCQAIQHAHQKGIIHRDIKPSNVMVTLYDGQPVPKVIDFGVAKATEHKLTERTLFTQYGAMIGTLEYMSPEQAEMSALGIDTRSDIYSLGVLLYELLTGSTPLTHKRMKEAAYAEILRLIKEEEPPKPSTRLSDSGEALASISAQRHTEPAKLSKLMRGELDWIVMKALDKDRNRRFETASGLAADVQRHLDDEPVQACPPSAAYRFHKLVRRNKLPFAAAAAVVVALVLGTVVSTWQAILANQARHHAVTEAAKATAISDFLQEMLRSANPEEANGMDYTVRELLDVFSVGLREQLQDQPEVEAAVRATLGRAYRRLGAADKAQPHLERALELRCQVYGEQHEMIAESLTDHAWNLKEQSRYPEAEAQAREALAIYRKRGTTGQPVMHALWTLYRMLQLQNRFEDEQAVVEEALTLARRSPDVEFPEVASMLHGLASSKNGRSEFIEAEKLARQALDMHRRLQGSKHPETGWALYTLGRSLQGQGKYAEAESNLREALGIFRQLYPSEHWSINRTLIALKSVLESSGKRRESDVLAEEQMQEPIRRMVRDKSMPDVWLELARSQLALNQLASAVASCEGACALAKQSKPQERFRVAAECAKISASVRSKLQKPHEARQIYRHTTALREPLARDAPPDVRLMQSSEYFELAFATTQPVEAEQVFATSIQLIRQLADEFPNNGRYRFELAKRYSCLATMLVKAGRGPDAEQAWRQASDELDAGIARGKIDGAGQASGAAWASLWLAGTAHREGRHELAERGFRQSITMFAQSVQDDPKYALLRESLGHTHWDLSDLLEQTNRRPQAEPVLREALQVFEQAANDFSDRPLYRQEQAFTHRKLGQLFIHLARFDDAERHHRLAIDLYARLVADDPKSAFYRREQASTTEMLASLLEPAGDLERAAAERRKALVLHQKAISDFPKEIEFTTRLGNNRIALANVLLKSRKYTEAAELFADSSSTPDQWRQCRNVASLFVRVISTAQSDTELSNDERKALADIAERRIAPLLTLAIERCPDNPDEQNELAWLLATDPEPLLREPHAAVTLAKLAVKKRPGTGIIWNRLGVAHYRAGNWKAAIEALTKSSQLQGDNSINFLFLAMAEWQIGNEDAARVWFDRAVASPPNQIPTDQAELRRFRAEAADLLGISEPAAEPTTDNAQITTDDGQPTTDN